MRTMVMVRVCQWCTATDKEKAFKYSLKDCCDSCGRMAWRSGRCGRCNGPKRRERCCRCDSPPKGKIEVILLDDSSEQERKVYRAPISQDIDEVTIHIGGSILRVTEPVVISLSRAEFIRILC